jgi:hypothetical protein
MKIRTFDGKIDRIDQAKTPIDQSLAEKVRADTRSSVEQVYRHAQQIGKERREAIESIDDQALKRTAQE